MNRPPLIALLLGLLAATCLFVMLGTGGVHAQAEAAQQDETDSGRTAVVESDENDQSGGRSEIETLPGPEDIGSAETSDNVAELPERFLLGTVLDPNFDPVPGAWVVTDVEATPVLTDEDGNFSIPLTKPYGQERWRAVKFWKEGFAVGSKWTCEPELRLVLKEDDGKEMQIVDAEGGLPLPGARVTALVESESDVESGFFELRNFVELPLEIPVADANGKVKIPDPEVSEFLIRVEMEGYDTRLLDNWDIDSRETIEMSRPKELRMQFVDADGQPHAGAQVCFPWYRKVVTLDEEGWGELPSEARWGFWSVQLRSENLQWVFTSIPRQQVQNGATLATNGLPRHGKLHVNGDEKATQFEVGITACHSRWGDQPIPDPRWNREAVQWYPVNEDGTFNAEPGWQGDQTMLHVRRIGSTGVALSEKLLGEAPYELTLSAAAEITLKVDTPDPSILDGASIRVNGRRHDHEQTIALNAGLGSARLPADEYYCSLVLAETTAEMPLERLYVAGMDMEHTFYFKGVRSLTGRITAAGNPVFPCRVDVNGDEGFWARVETDPDGKWELKKAPLSGLNLSPRPENRWLQPVQKSRFRAEAYDTNVDYEIPTAVLLVSLGDFPAEQLDKLQVYRRRGDTSRLTPTSNGRNYSRSTSAEIEGLEDGPVEILTTPGAVQFSTQRSAPPLARQNLELYAGDVQSFRIDTVPSTQVSVRIEGVPGRLYTSVRYTCEDPSILAEYPDFSPQTGSHRKDGQLGYSMHLANGRWKARVKGPFWCNSWQTQIGHGELEFDLDLSGGQKTVWLKLDAEDRLHLSE